MRSTGTVISLVKTLQRFRKLSRGLSMRSNVDVAEPPVAGLIDEEHIPDYDVRAVYPVRPGQIFIDKYRIIGKVGWGTASTVWIAEVLQRAWWRRWLGKEYVTLKVGNTALEHKRPVDHELKISPRLDRDSTHRGYPFVRTVLDSFEINGSHGRHVCLVHKPMRESLWSFQNRFLDGKLPAAFMKPYIKVLLLGLDYLHTVCHVIHTDLKAVNIMVDFEDMDLIQSRLEPAMRAQQKPTVTDGRYVFRTFQDWGWPRNWRILPKIADFGLAREGDAKTPYRLPIQPPYYTAPEVMMGIGWSYSADIWNMGVLENVELFGHLLGSDEVYEPRNHIAEMIALLGPPPAELIHRERNWTGIGWGQALPNARGKLCSGPQEYYEGPYFDEKGKFRFEDLMPCRPSLEDSVMSLSGEEKSLFVDFMRKMLQWLPEQRLTAGELAEHPWLSSDGNLHQS